MLRRAFAVWLVLLIVTPFTAPFSTCEFNMLVSRPTRHSVPPARSTRRLEADASIATPVAPLTRQLGRIRTPLLVRIHDVTSARNAGTDLRRARGVTSPTSPTIALTALRV